MPDHAAWPPTYNALHAAARCLCYLMAAVAGLDVAFGSDEIFAFNIDAIGLLAALGGSAAFLGTLFRQWTVELVAVYALTAAMLTYTLIDWLILIFVVGYPPITMASVAILSGACVVGAVATGQYRYRWAALAGALIVVGLAVPLSARNPAVITLVTCLLFARALDLTVFKNSTIRARKQRRPPVPSET